MPPHSLEESTSALPNSQGIDWQYRHVFQKICSSRIVFSFGSPNSCGSNSRRMWGCPEIRHNLLGFSEGFLLGGQVNPHHLGAFDAVLSCRGGAQSKSAFKQVCPSSNPNSPSREDRDWLSTKLSVLVNLRRETSGVPEDPSLYWRGLQSGFAIRQVLRDWVWYQWPQFLETLRYGHVGKKWFQYGAHLCSRSVQCDYKRKGYTDGDIKSWGSEEVSGWNVPSKYLVYGDHFTG